MKEEKLERAAIAEPPEAAEKPPSTDEIVIPLIGMKLERQLLPWIVASLGILLVLGWYLLSSLPAVWFDEEGYYSHGLLIPFMAIAVIYARREKIKQEPIGSSVMGLIVMILGLLLLVASKLIDNISLAAFAFILAIIGGIYFAFGKKIGRHCVSPVLFLMFMMPVLGWVIDTYTNPLQIISTKISAKMLNIIGFQTAMSDVSPTVIHMNTYTLLVGGPCSGFKLILSLVAFTSFFIMISNLGFKKNLLLLALTLPLALFINGLRIVLIGAVGENRFSGFGQWLEGYGNGKDAGMVFHDYSGYIMLIVCFIILHFIVRALEGKKTENAATT